MWASFSGPSLELDVSRVLRGFWTILPYSWSTIFKYFRTVGTDNPVVAPCPTLPTSPDAAPSRGIILVVLSLQSARIDVAA